MAVHGANCGCVRVHRWRVGVQHSGSEGRSACGQPQKETVVVGILGNNDDEWAHHHPSLIAEKTIERTHSADVPADSST